MTSMANNAYDAKVGCLDSYALLAQHVMLRGLTQPSADCRPVHFMGDMLDSYALAKLVILISRRLSHALVVRSGTAFAWRRLEG